MNEANKMAYMNTEMKKQRAPAIAALCKKYGVKATLAVNNHSTLVLNISKGAIDFRALSIGQFSYQVNHYYIDEQFTGMAREFLEEAYKEMMVGNHNNSDIQTDYFDVGFYVNINIGKWDRPYEYIA
jgi:hypothetical protein